MECRLQNGVIFLLTSQLKALKTLVKLVIEILPMLLSYISTNYTPYHTKAKTSVYYFSYKRNFNSFYQPGIT